MDAKSRQFTAAGLMAAAFPALSPALATGTPQGTNIINGVTVSYRVRGVQQNSATASDSFVVDRKVNLIVSEAGAAATSVSPGQRDAVTIFTVTNSSNDTLDFGLEATNQTGGAAKFTGSDNYDVATLALYRETNGEAGLQTGTGGDAPVTFLDEVEADQTITVYVLGDVPRGRSTGDVATVRLAATARSGGAAGAQGAALTQTAGANTAGVDTVFADDAANGNDARDGTSFDRDDYRVAAAAITASKTSRIVWDPVNLGTDPKILPGAVVEYCIAVSNSAGSATATEVAISDALPEETSFLSDASDANFIGIRVNGTVNGSECNADGVPGGSHADGVVNASLANIAAGVTRTLLFRVVVD